MSGSQLKSRVLVVDYEPTIPSASDHTLSQVLGWNEVDRLIRSFIGDLRTASHGICEYQIVDRIQLDAFPVKEDGFQYTAENYLRSWRNGHGFHTPDWADYDQILRESGALNAIIKGNADEIWLFAFPYGGFYESRMVGPGSFWCNSPPLSGYDLLDRRCVIMGFNYERGVGEMLESYGHRAEAILHQLYSARTGDENYWERFCRTHLTHPGLAEVGTVHFAPNSRSDYEWDSREIVPSRCDNWYNFPDLVGNPRMVDSREWGDGDLREHHMWWFHHLPHGEGRHQGLLNNWWEYIVDPNKVNVKGWD